MTHCRHNKKVRLYCYCLFFLFFPTIFLVTNAYAVSGGRWSGPTLPQSPSGEVGTIEFSVLGRSIYNTEIGMWAWNIDANTYDLVIIAPTQFLSFADGSFSYNNGDLDFEGAFSDLTTCSGTWELDTVLWDGQRRIGSGTWTATAESPMANMILDSSGNDFGNQDVYSTSTARSFYLTNIGAGTGSGTVYFKINYSDFFRITSGGGYFSIPAGGSKEIQIVFEPTSLGYHEAEVWADRNYYINILPLSGTGVYPRVLSVTPDYINVYADSGCTTFEVENLGYGSMDWTITSEDDWITEITPYFGTNNGTVAVCYEANSSYSSRTATLTTTVVDAIYSPQNFEIRQAGFRPPNLSLTPLSHDYGRQNIDSSSMNASFTLYNSGGTTALGTISLTGGDTNNYRITTGGGPLSLGPYETQIIEVVFEPVSFGSKSATLSVAGDPPGNEVASSLAGIGIYPHLPILAVTPDYQEVSAEGGEITFEIENQNFGAMDWNVSTDAFWITDISPTSGTDNGIITVSCEANPGFSRTAIITIAAPGAQLGSPKTVEVRQDEDIFSKLTPLDGGTDDQFGISTFFLGEYAIIGSPYTDENGTDSGAAYVFKRDGNLWVEQAKLTALDGAAEDHFGTAVSLYGDYALVGADDVDGDDLDFGAAYIFKRDGENWTQQAKLVAPDGEIYDHFGRSVSLYGDYALVGADGHLAGAVYVFKLEDGEWIEHDKLSATDGVGSDLFGSSVSLFGDYALIGALGDDSFAGSAYIFKREAEEWIEETKLLALDYRAASDYFGRAVSLYENYALIGAHGHGAGTAYIFKREGNSWLEPIQLSASGGGSSDGFGVSLCLSDNYAIIGAKWNDSVGYNSGAAYVFERTGDLWTELGKLTAPDGAANDYFGTSVGLYGNSAIVGASGDDNPNGADAGAAYIVDLTTASNSILHVMPGGFDVFAYDTTASFDIKNSGNLPMNWSITTDADWITDISPGEGINDALINFTFESNLGSARTAVISVEAPSAWNSPTLIEVNQAAFGPAVLSVTPNSVDVFADSGTAIFVIENPGGDNMDWTVSSDDTWIDITPISGTNNGIITVNYEANSGSARSAVLTIVAPGALNSPTDVLIDQTRYSSPYLSFAPSSYAFADQEVNTGSQAISFVLKNTGNTTSTGSVSLEDEAADEFRIIEGEGAFSLGPTQTKTITAVFEPTSPGFKETTLLAAGDLPGYGRTTSASLSGTGLYLDLPILSVTPDEISITAASGSTSFEIENTGFGTMDWTVSTDAAWITDITPLSGTEEGTITVSYEANRGLGRRAIITILAPEAQIGSPKTVALRQDQNGVIALKIMPADCATNDEFGYAVALAGDYAIVGAPYNRANSYRDAGAAYIFHRQGNGWTEETKLTGSYSSYMDHFGKSVSIFGNYALVGVPDDESNRGSAYIFEHESDWVRQPMLSGVSEQAFGNAVSLSGDYAIVGAYYDDENGSFAGAVYVYYREGAGWIEQAKLTASDGEGADLFGRSVSASGEYIIIGASGDDDNGSGAGAAYIFKREDGSWTEQVKLAPEDGEPSDSFGRSVSIAGNYAIVGATGDDDNGSGSGSIYIFKYNGSSWVEDVKFVPSDGEASDSFGTAVSISDNYAIAGASGDDDNGSGAGAAYVFMLEGNEWSELGKLTAPDGAPDDSFGKAVGVSNGYAIVGASKNDDRVNDSGAAYMFALRNITPFCTGDMDGDDDSDGIDLIDFGLDFDTCLSDCKGDLNGDGQVNHNDLELFSKEFGRPECTRGFFEDFNDNVADNWFELDHDYWSVTDGVYRMAGGVPALDVYTHTHYDDEFSDFTYQVLVSRISGPLDYPAGITFRSDSTWQNGYRFVIAEASGNGYYRLMKYLNGSSTVFLDWTINSVINPGYFVCNSLKVICSGPILKFYINGFLVAMLEDSEFSTGQAGLMATDVSDDDGNVTIVDFDDIELVAD